MIANGLFFSLLFEVLPTKNFLISSWIDFLLGSSSSGFCTNPSTKSVNSLRASGEAKIEDGELLSNVPSAVAYAFAIAPNLVGIDRALIW